MFASHGCTVTVITVLPTVSTAESDHLSTFFAIHPNINRLEFHLLPYKKSKFTNEDPFFIQMESINSSVHLLHPLLSSLSPSLSAIVADFPVTATVTQLASELSVSVYTVITTSARFFTLMAHLPQLAQDNSTKFDKFDANSYIEIPGLGPMAVSSVPPIMLNKNHFFAANISSNISSLFKTKGVLINTFNWFESEAIEALRRNGLAQILPIGPTALSKDQTRELANGLENSNCKFLWVLKTSKVDKDDKEEVEEILGESFLARTENKGMVIKGWVNQERILAHPAIGGFVSHCGWNSVMEAARLGVPILAWPQHGDQCVNAEVVEKVGLGLWARGWGWGGEKLVGENEIAEKIRELMVNMSLRARAKEVKENARQAREVNGSSEGLVQGLIDSLKSF
ncbi:hypothetical protein DH2020_009295 [Rehmannia glutinosa]|uniref:Glycosyltransferase n=1 Tax=Rehmannia glutinosa TaxID=99300 RepID=A0ABR0X5W8_REHGL